MCLFSPKIPDPEPIPPMPTRDSADSIKQAEDQRRRLRLRRGMSSTKLTGPLGDSSYGGSISRATVLGGTT